MPDATKFCNELQLKAVGAAAAQVHPTPPTHPAHTPRPHHTPHTLTPSRRHGQAAKEELKKSGMAGVGAVTKAAATVPVSPRLNKPRPPKLPEPEKITTQFVAPSVPEYLEFTNLDMINQQRKEELQAQREKTQAKYGDKYRFQFQELKAGRDLEEVRREVEEARTKDINFNATFVHEPPDFSKIPAKVRLSPHALPSPLSP